MTDCEAKQAKNPDLYPGSLIRLTPLWWDLAVKFACYKILQLSSTAVSKPKQVSKIGTSLLIPLRITQMTMGSFLFRIYSYIPWHAFRVWLAPIK